MTGCSWPAGCQGKNWQYVFVLHWLAKLGPSSGTGDPAAAPEPALLQEGARLAGEANVPTAPGMSRVCAAATTLAPVWAPAVLATVRAESGTQEPWVTSGTWRSRDRQVPRQVLTVLFSPCSQDDQIHSGNRPPGPHHPPPAGSPSAPSCSCSPPLPGGEDPAEPQQRHTPCQHRGFTVFIDQA